MAGIRQITNPAFTAKEIFHIDSMASLAIVRELGFANLCFWANWTYFAAPTIVENSKCFREWFIMGTCRSLTFTEKAGRSK